MRSRMRTCDLQKFISSTLVVALVVATAPAFAAPSPATLTGTVFASDVKTPLAGATVVVTDVNGVKTASQPTGTDGAFSVRSLTPGRIALALETKDGSFAVATPVTLAPGEARGVHLALKSGSDPNEEKKKSGGGPYWTGGAIGSMTAVLVGFVAAALVNSHELREGPTSPSLPEEK